MNEYLSLEFKLQRLEDRVRNLEYKLRESPEIDGEIKEYITDGD